MRSGARSGHLSHAAGLAVLAPLVAEVVASSNTPAVLFPVLLPLLVVIYGLPALLIREIWVRRGVGWATVIVLGIGYTALNEGLVAATWFKLDPEDAKVLVFTADEVGRAGGVNWTLATGLSLFHTIWSIAIPIALMEVWARRRGLAGVRWLGPWATRLALALVAFVVVGSLSGDATRQLCEGPSQAVYDECAAGRRISAALVALAALIAVVAPRPRRRDPVAGRTRPSDRVLR